LACSETASPPVFATQLESELLRPIGEENVHFVPPDQPEVLVKKELTLAEHIENSLLNEPLKWKWIHGERLQHPNGTNLYVNGNYVCLSGEYDVYLSVEEQKRISSAANKCLERIRDHKARQAHQRALRRWTHPSTKKSS
jgi:hypothetical protein